MDASSYESDSDLLGSRCAVGKQVEKGRGVSVGVTTRCSSSRIALFSRCHVVAPSESGTAHKRRACSMRHPAGYDLL